MAPRFICESDIAGRLSWPEMVELLAEGHAYEPAEIADTFLGTPDRTLLNRAAWIRGIGGGVKSVTVFTGNPARDLGLPAAQGVFLLFDHGTGALRAMIDARLITKWKTAADSVLGAKLLMNPGARDVAIIGAGELAHSLAQAYVESIPELERISIWARRPGEAEQLATSLNNEKIRPAKGDLEETVRNADIVSTATSSSRPVVCGHWVSPGAHVDLVGAFRREMREADDALMSKANIYVDCRETTIQHIGELMEPIAGGVISKADIRGDLYDLTAGTVGRCTNDEITVFKNGGGAHLDLMVAAAILRAAEKTPCGRSR